MDRKYKTSLFAYLFFVVFLQLGGVFLLFPGSIIAILYKLYPNFTFDLWGLAITFERNAINYIDIVVFLGTLVFSISLILSDALVCAFYALIFGQWSLNLKTEGIYGYTIPMLLTSHRYRQLCTWDEIESVSKKGFNLFDIGIYRIYFNLKNGERFAIVKIGNTPYDSDNFLNTSNQDDQNTKYSIYTLMAYVASKIGREKLVGFPKDFWKDFELASSQLLYLNPEDEGKENEKHIESHKKRDEIYYNSEAKKEMKEDLERIRKLYGEDDKDT